MSPERSHAYKRVMQTLEDLGPAKLQSTEQERIRDAADSLLFCEAPAAAEATDALTDVLSLCEALVASGRWQAATADRLAGDIAACGPPAELIAA